MEHQGLEKIMVKLNEYGFGSQLAMKIYQTYKDETMMVIEKNPYQLVEDIEGIGFRRADELGFKLGIHGNHPDRIKAACLYQLEEDCLQEGHCYLDRDYFILSVQELLQSNQTFAINKEDIEQEILKLEEEGETNYRTTTCFSSVDLFC